MAYCYLVGGKILYDTLFANLPIPHISTIYKEICNHSATLIEGACRVTDLKIFLEARNLPPLVWLSEDATRISNQIQYDHKSNQLIGFVLPFDNNGMPIAFSFCATSAKAIENFFLQHTPASSLYTVMAQPIDDNAPAFCLMLFGTDNRFTTDHVLNRWSYIKKTLFKHGIQVVGVSADGDSRLLKAMRIETKFGLQNPDFSTVKADFNIPEFHATVNPNLICTQDTVHIGGKLRNRFLKPSLIMPLGKYFVSPGHLNVLMDLVTKDKHMLNPCDISPRDKMNFASVIKICDPRIWHLLQAKVPGSEGTLSYLRIMYFVIISFLCKTMPISDRIYYIWYSVFFLRLWRAWMKNEPNYSSTNNCITLNTYICIELNAHALLNLIFSCIQENSTKHFLPWQFGSQQCESFYRNLRSMTSTYSTVVNFTLLEAIHRIQRIQYQADISVENFEAKGETFCFPRTRHLNTNYEIQENKIPSPTTHLLNINNDTLDYCDVLRVLKLSKDAAYKDISQLGMSVMIDESDNVQIQNLIVNEHCERLESSENEDDSLILAGSNENLENLVIDEETEKDLKILNNLNGKIELPTPKKKKLELKPDDEFTVVIDSFNTEYVVRKSSICWLMNNKKTKLSSDRLERVKASDYQQLAKLSRTSNSSNIDSCTVCEEIFVGDWGLFKELDGSKCLVGMVLGFGYIEGKTWKSSEYTSNYAKVEGNKKSVGVLCQWYNVYRKGNLLPLDILVHGYIPIDSYKLTLPVPVYNGQSISLNESIFLKIKKEVMILTQKEKERSKKSKRVRK